jgi:hypothetical protein
MSKQLSIIFSIGITFFATIVPNALSPQPAQADTLDDIGKAIGVWQRFMKDLQRTQSQTTPPIQPEDSTPPLSSDEPEESEVTE